MNRCHASFPAKRHPCNWEMNKPGSAKMMSGRDHIRGSGIYLHRRIIV
jgi:hypothetical protein